MTAKKTIFTRVLLAAGLAQALSLATFAAEREPIFGVELMSAKERAEYAASLRFADSDDERTALIQEHREAMVERARRLGRPIPGSSSP